MGNYKIESAEASDLNNALTDYSVPSQETDGADGQKEFFLQMKNWSQNLGYYKSIPELRTAIDAKTRWIVGAGYESDEGTTLLLDQIRGFGKDSFNTILKNLERVRQIGGDAFAEIITNNNDELINLKPLDPSSILVIFNRGGIIIRYEQVSIIEGNDNQKFEPEEILHLSRDRIADEVHGISVIEAVEDIILMRNESKDD